MILKIHKILFIFLLIALQVSCAADDFEDDPGYVFDNQMGMGSSHAYSNGFVINQPWWKFSGLVSADTITQNADTLRAFPSQKAFTEKTLSYVFGLQDLASEVLSMLRGIVIEQDNAGWMNFYSPYLGAFVSVSDSRVKQWQLETDVAYDGVKWPYHLLISDLPDGAMTGKVTKALDIYYDFEFKNGIMIFSPSRFNSVRFPEKLMGHNMMCRLNFSTIDNVVENTLYVSEFGNGASPDRYGNLFLNTKLSANSVSFACIVDMPYLWFDVAENSGYSVMMAGGIDCASRNVALLAGFAPNTISSTALYSLMSRESVASKMQDYNAMWNKMKGLEDSDSTLAVYQTPAFLTDGAFVGAGREVAERAMFARALAKAEEIENGVFDVSPLKVAILQIEW